MKKILERLYNHERLSQQEAKQILCDISSEKYNPTEVASFITVFLMRAISPAELEGFKDALLELCIKMDTQGVQSIDVCGTGGDGKNTFNISTLSSFVVAGAGYKVTKHGNYGVSSGCGSSNVLEAIGYKFSNDTDLLHRQLDDANICFLHAPLFHPALKSVGPIRRALGVKTFFNMLGPLVNPARPIHQMTGVFNLQLLRLYQYLFEKSSVQYAIVHGLSGFDEISLTDDTKVVSSYQGEMIVNAKTFGFDLLKLSEIEGGRDVESSKAIFLKVLNNQGTEAQNKVVLANSALAIQCFEPNSNLVDCYQIAKEALISGKALAVLNKVVKLSN